MAHFQRYQLWKENVLRNLSNAGGTLGHWGVRLVWKCEKYVANFSIAVSNCLPLDGCHPCVSVFCWQVPARRSKHFASLWARIDPEPCREGKGAVVLRFCKRYAFIRRSCIGQRCHCNALELKYFLVFFGGFNYANYL